MRRGVAFATLLALASATAPLVPSQEASAADWTVTSAADEGSGTLREAITQASATPPSGDPHLIAIQANLSIELESEIVYTGSDDLAIVGNGAVITVAPFEPDSITDRLLRSTDPSGSISLVSLDLSGGVHDGPGGIVLTAGDLAISGSTLTGTSTAALGAPGGAVRADGDLTLHDVSLVGNGTTGLWSPGGAASAGGALTMTGGEVGGNSTTGEDSPGGGLHSETAIHVYGAEVGGNSTDGEDSPGGAIAAVGPVDITGTAVMGNSTGANDSPGGGLFATASATVTTSAFHGNSTAGEVAGGGAVWAADVAASRSTFKGNSTEMDSSPGGAVLAAAGAVIDTSSFGGNSSADSSAEHNGGDGEGGVGGDLAVPSGGAEIQTSTFVGSSAPGGGAISVGESGHNPSFGAAGENSRIQSTVIIGASDRACDVPSSTSSSYVATTDGTCTGQDLLLTGPTVELLGDFGGPTETAPPEIGSALINRVPPGEPGCEVDAVDQRGEPRLVGGACDIGAVERQAAPAIPLSISGGPFRGPAPLSTSVSALHGASGPTTYHWDFGDGTTATGLTAAHTYTTEGWHLITLTATDESGPRTVMRFVEVTGDEAWLALGDSFTSGQGAGNETGCHRSPNAYINFGLPGITQSVQLACGGATTYDVLDGGDGQPQQIEVLEQALEDHPNISTIALTIGGNDLGFANVLTGCVIADAIRVPCAAYLAPFGDLYAQFDALEERLVTDVYPAIRRVAGSRDVLVLGYPAIFPSIPLPPCDVRLIDAAYMRHMTRELNRRVASAARRAGLTYVDTFDAFAGHELCRFIFGLPWAQGLLTGGINGSFHPNALGHAALNRRIRECLETGNHCVRSERLYIEPGAGHGRTHYASADLRSITFATRWMGSTVELELRGPDGEVVTPASTRPGVTTVTTANSVNITIEAPAGGEWTARLIGTDLPPEGEPVALTVTEEPEGVPVPPAPPIAEAVADPVTATVGEDVTFESLSGDLDGTIVEETWEFDDGASESGTSVEHQFETAGTHEATLTVTSDDDMTASATIDVEVVPAPEGTVSGTVTNATTEEPVPGAWIAVLRTSDFSIAGGAVADASGDYSATLPVGTYFFYLVDPAAAHTAGFFGSPTLVSITEGVMSDADPTMASSRGTVTGTVTDDAGATPVAGAWVLSLGGSQTQTEVGVQTDASGQYTLPDLRSGNHFVGFIDPTGAHVPEFWPNSPNVPESTPIATTAGGTTQADGFLTSQSAPPGETTLSGTVTEAGSGDPLGDVFVAALRASDYHMVRVATTDSSGHYTLDVPADGYKLAFVDTNGLRGMEWHENHPNTGLEDAATVDSPAETDAELDPLTASISGTVADDETTDPVAGAWVIALIGGQIAGGAVSAGDGTYTIAGLAPGNYRVTIVDPSGGRRQEYYDDSTDYDGGSDVTITAGATATIDAALALPAP